MSWGGVQLGPLGTAATNGLLCQPRVIMMMEKSVEWLAGEIEVLGENLSQWRFVHHKPYMPARTRTRAAAMETQRLTAWATARPGDTCYYTFLLPRVTVFVKSLVSLLRCNHSDAIQIIESGDVGRDVTGNV
jgi:hypothetical protein